MTQKPERRSSCCPSSPSTAHELQEHWDYIYEPDATEILDGLLMRYIESQVYRGGRGKRRQRNGRAHGGHEGAPPTTPASSSANCSSIYNKARQAAITEGTSRRSSAARQRSEMRETN